MRARGWTTGLTIALAAASVAMGLTPAGAGSHRVEQRLVLTTAQGKSEAGSSQLVRAAAPPMVALPRRARVLFTVPRKVLLLPFEFGLPAAAGRYLAFYFPDAGEGWAAVPDAASVRHWPATLEFGGGGFTNLYPHHTYTMFVALDHAATVQMPIAMHVVRVRPSDFSADVVIHPVALATSSVVAADWAADPVGRYQLSTTAIALDWHVDSAPVEVRRGDACHSLSPLPSCSPGNNLSYFSETSELGVAGPRQVVMGEGYAQPEPSAYISGYAANVPAPFDAATLYGFGMTPPAV
jgi:hypothetical protein